MAAEHRKVDFISKWADQLQWKMVTNNSLLKQNMYSAKKMDHSKNISEYARSTKKPLFFFLKFWLQAKVGRNRKKIFSQTSVDRIRLCTLKKKT